MITFYLNCQSWRPPVSLETTCYDVNRRSLYEYQILIYSIENPLTEPAAAVTRRKVTTILLYGWMDNKEGIKITRTSVLGKYSYKNFTKILFEQLNYSLLLFVFKICLEIIISVIEYFKISLHCEISPLKSPGPRRGSNEVSRIYSQEIRLGVQGLSRPSVSFSRINWRSDNLTFLLKLNEAF